MLMAKYIKKSTKKVLSPKKLRPIKIDAEVERKKRQKMRWFAHNWIQVFFSYLRVREIVRLQAVCPEYYDTIIPKFLKRIPLNKNRLQLERLQLEAPRNAKPLLAEYYKKVGPLLIS